MTRPTVTQLHVGSAPYRSPEGYSAPRCSGICGTG